MPSECMTGAACALVLSDKTMRVFKHNRKAGTCLQVMGVLLLACASPSAGHVHEVQVEIGTRSRTYEEFNLSVTFSRPSKNFTLDDLHITGAYVLAIIPWPEVAGDQFRTSFKPNLGTHFFAVSAQS